MTERWMLPRPERMVPDELCLPEYDIEWTAADEQEANQARQRAEAWAQSPIGTPYPAKEPKP